jgi:hypothetical protein
MLAGWCLIAVLAQTPDIISGPPSSRAEGSFRNGIRARQNPESHQFPAEMFFRHAAEAYESVRRSEGIRSPELERSLGHAYSLYGDLPRAVLAYHRGRRLDPGDAKLETALAHARARVEYPPSQMAALMQPEREYWPGWLELHRLALVALVAYTVACLAVTRWRMSPRRLWLWIALSAAVVVMVPAIGSGVEWARRQRDEAMPVVVLARAEMLRTGNGVEYPPRLDAALPRGAEVRRLFERAAWYQVELSSGVAGWLPREAVVEEN